MGLELENGRISKYGLYLQGPYSYWGRQDMRANKIEACRIGKEVNRRGATVVGGVRCYFQWRTLNAPVRPGQIAQCATHDFLPVFYTL